MLKQIGINSFWFFLSRILTQLLHLVFIGIVARNLGVSAFGYYVLFALILFIGNIFTTYGTDALLIREVTPTGKISGSFSASAWLQISLSVLWISALFLLSTFMEYDSPTRNALLMLNLGLIPLSFQSVVSSVLRALERMEIYFALGVLSLIMHVTFAFLLVKNPDDLFLLCVLLLLDKVFIAALGLFICKKFVSESIIIRKPVFSEIINIFFSGWKLALFFPLSALHQRLNLFVISFILGQELTGVFSASTRLMDGVKIGHFSLSNSLMPAMARSQSDQINSTLKKSLSLLLIWSIAASIGVLIFAKTLIEIIYGAAYLNSVPALKIISFVLIPYTFSTYFSLKLIMRHKENLVFNVTLISLLIATILYIWLISNFGLIGAAWGTLINEIIYAGILAFVGIQRNIKL